MLFPKFLDSRRLDFLISLQPLRVHLIVKELPCSVTGEAFTFPAEVDRMLLGTFQDKAALNAATVMLPVAAAGTGAAAHLLQLLHENAKPVRLIWVMRFIKLLHTVQIMKQLPCGLAEDPPVHIPRRYGTPRSMALFFLGFLLYSWEASFLYSVRLYFPRHTESPFQSDDSFHAQEGDRVPLRFEIREERQVL